MKRIIIILAILLSFAVSVHAELYNRGAGLIYDSDFDITILQDANYSYTSGYDDDGRMSWWGAMTWADQLYYYDSVRDVYWDDWRLTSAYNIDGSGPIGEAYVTTSEFGHMYLNKSFFYNVQTSHLYGNAYWTGTDNNSGLAYEYSFETGWQEMTEKPKHYFVWAVRDGDVAPTVIPEPISSILFITGGGVLAGRRYFWRKRDKKLI